ncbi:hypothetical protein JCM14076_06370 [Methylosoma difficile]
MSDLADDANRAAAHDLNVSLVRSQKAVPEIVANGYCHNCGHPVPDKRRWCDADCCDEWLEEGWLNGH